MPAVLEHLSGPVDEGEGRKGTQSHSALETSVWLRVQGGSCQGQGRALRSAT